MYIKYVDKSSWQSWLELVVALYYVVDCAIEVLRWHWQEVKHWNIYLDTGLDLSFYVYYLLRAMQLEMQTQRRDLEGYEDTADYVAAPNTVVRDQSELV